MNSKLHEPGWPLCLTSRDFFESANSDFRSIYQKSPVIAVDLPSVWELDDGRIDKPTIAIIGQDSKHNKDHSELIVGTPYGLHHKGSRENLTHTKLYFEMVEVLLALGYRVYLTDLLKIWVCNPEQRYVGIKLPNDDQQRFRELIKPELDVVRPCAVVTWGKLAGTAVDQLNLGIKHVKCIHPSGAANGAFKKLTGLSPNYSNKLNNWRTTTTQALEN